MSNAKLRKAFTAFYLTLGIVVFIQSLTTAIHALTGADHALLGLACIEAFAAVMFLIPKTVRPGGVLLLVTFAIAFVVHLLHGEPYLGLLVYAMGTLFVMVHGPLSFRDTA